MKQMGTLQGLWVRSSGSMTWSSIGAHLAGRNCAVHEAQRAQQRVPGAQLLQHLFVVQTDGEMPVYLISVYCNI